MSEQSWSAAFFKQGCQILKIDQVIGYSHIVYKMFETDLYCHGWAGNASE